MEKNSGGNVVIHDLDFGILKIPKSQKNPKKIQKSKKIQKKIPKSQIRLFPLGKNSRMESDQIQNESSRVEPNMN